MPRRLNRRRRRFLPSLVAVAAVLAAGACSASHHVRPARSTAAVGSAGAPGRPAPATPGRPNVVFVLTDDLAWNLVPYLPHVRALEQAGLTFTNYTVTDSLCCPSRASILTGEFPHNTHVTSNDPPTGGFTRFAALGEEAHTFATSTHAAGYRTALIGKYLNHYAPKDRHTSPTSWLTGAHVPAGWTTWHGVDGHGYGEFDYTMADGHAVTRYGHRSSDYLTDVAGRLSSRFIRSSVAAGSPFLLELATFAPHAPATPAPADRGTFPGLRAPRTPRYDRLPTDPPPWLAGRAPLDAAESAKIDRAFERRVESVQAVDRVIGDLEQTLRDTHQDKNTVVIFSSDNGFHMGDYRLFPGKQTAYDTDVRVPLIAAGPGIAPGTTNDAVVENIDLAPTFDDLAGAATPKTVDGHSLVPLLHGLRPRWRTVAAIEHLKPAYMLSDPDRQTTYQGVPPSYDAIRTATYTYVRYLDGEREFYDRSRDPSELHNLAARLTPARRAALDRIVAGLTTCRGAAQCWAAGRPAMG